MNKTISFSKGLSDISAYNPLTSPSNRHSNDNNDKINLEKKLCTTCNEYIEIGIFRNHFKDEWHRYNLYRKQKSLPPINYDMFLERKEIARQQTLIVKQKGQDHIKNKNSCTSDINSESDISFDTPNKYIKKIKDDDIKYSSGMSIFDARYIGTPIEALNFMMEHNNFYLPEQEYISNLSGLLEYLGNIVFIDNECLYCGRVFSSLYAVWHHMEAKGHQKIPYEMIEEIYQFYDFGDELHDKNGQLIDNDDDWEDVDESDGNGIHDSIRIYSRDIKPATIDENNNLTLSDGREVVNRSIAYIYKQHLKPLRIINGGILISKSENILSKRDFKGKITCLRDKIRQNIHKDIRSYKLFKVRSQNIIFN